MEMLELILTALDNKFSELKAIREKRTARILSRYSEANNEIEPNTDRMGRFHAPCDGYEDIDGKSIYGKGEFLPIPEIIFEELKMEGITCDRGSKIFGQRTRILVTADDAHDLGEILQLNYGLTASKGKEFTRGETVMCYLYISGNDSLVKTVEEAIKEAKEADRAAKRLLKGVAPEGKQIIKVKLVFIKTIAPLAPWEETTYKMLCELDNKATVWGTLPKALHGSELGVEFNLKGTFKQAEGDNTHAFVSRPSIAK